jgi:phage shock protein A
MMYMLSTLDVLYGEVQRAKRIEAYCEEEPKMQIRWKNSSREGMGRGDWEKRFAKEALSAYPDIKDYVAAVEAKNIMLEETVRELRVKILELEEGKTDAK